MSSKWINKYVMICKEKHSKFKNSIEKQTKKTVMKYKQPKTKY